MSWLSSMWKSHKTWYKGLANTAKFWDPKKVAKGVKQQWSFKGDPLGRNVLNKLVFPDAESTPVNTSSASGWTNISGTGFRRYY